MITKRSLITLLLFSSFLFSLEQRALGQAKLTSCTDIKDSKDFYLLGTTAGELNSQIKQLEIDLKDFQSELAEAIPEKQITQYKQEIDQLQQKTTRTPVEANRLEFLSLRVQRAVTVEAVNDKIANAKKALDEKRDLVSCIQQRLSSIFSPDQTFKLTMSISFAVLIGLVIAGFFGLSNKDGLMRRAIFAGQTGIQFLTLFSIVIAIILFGITGILQDKELAALLGGISGYILGRSSTGTSASGSSFVDRLGSITISPDSLSLTPTSQTSQLNITTKDKSGNVFTDDSGDFKPVWSSSDLAVASVSKTGLVTRVAAGTCNVSASFNNITSNTCVVTCS